MARSVPHATLMIRATATAIMVCDAFPASALFNLRARIRIHAKTITLLIGRAPTASVWIIRHLRRQRVLPPPPPSGSHVRVRTVKFSLTRNILTSRAVRMGHCAATPFHHIGYPPRTMQRKMGHAQPRALSQTENGSELLLAWKRSVIRLLPSMVTVTPKLRRASHATTAITIVQNQRCAHAQMEFQQ
jgi:hypothetical protein